MADERWQDPEAQMQPQLRQDETPDGEIARAREEGAVVVDVIGVEPESRAEVSKAVVGSMNAEHAEVRGMAGVVRADRAEVRGISGLVAARKAELYGVSPWVLSAEKAEIERGAALGVLAGRSVTVEEHGFVGFAVAPKVDVQPGGRVLVTPLIALIIGAAAGTGFGLVALAGVWVFRESFRSIRRIPPMRILGGFGGMARRASRVVRAGMEAW